MSHASRPVRPATDSWFNQLDELPPGPATRIAPPPFGGGSQDRPVDQAQGLRRLFTSHTLRCIPIVSNPLIAFGGSLLERLCTAYAELGLRTLVVDAGEHARAPVELANFDLAEGVEMLSPQVSYLAARGLPLRYVDASGSTSAFLDAVAEAAPDTDVLLVHASASDLARLFARRVQELQAHLLRPVVLCDEQADSVTHAYAAIKLLAMRAGLMAHDLLLSAPPESERAARVAERLARCADDFLGAVQHDWVAVDPAEAATDAPSLRLKRLAREQLACALPQPLSDSAFAALTTESDGLRSVLPAQGSRHANRMAWSR